MVGDRRQNNPSFNEFATRPILAVGRCLLAPLRVLYYGHVLYLLYVAALLAVTAILLSRAEFYLLEWLKLAHKDTAMSAAALARLNLGTAVFTWLIFVPVTITALAFPVRMIHISKSAQLGTLLKYTPRTVKDCLRSCVISATSILYVASPALTIVLGYFFWAKNLNQKSLQQLYILVCLIAVVISFMRTLPYWFTPVIAVCGQYPPRYALFLSDKVLRNKKRVLFLFTMLGAGGVVLLHACLDSVAAQLIGFAVLGWYLITYAAIYITHALAEFETAQAGQEQTNTVHYAPPPQFRPYVAAAQPAPAAMPEEIYVRVENLRVMK